MKLVLASHDLEPGTIIRELDLVLTDWLGEVPAGAPSHTQGVIGRGVFNKIYAKEPVVQACLAPKGAGGAFSATIPQGMRAAAVPVSEVVGAAGFAVPGMHVDVLISNNDVEQGIPPAFETAYGSSTERRAAARGKEAAEIRNSLSQPPSPKRSRPRRKPVNSTYGAKPSSWSPSILLPFSVYQKHLTKK